MGRADPRTAELLEDKLKKAGHWAEEYGETIFQGCFWGQVADIVGHAVAGG